MMTAALAAIYKTITKKQRTVSWIFIVNNDNCENWSWPELDPSLSSGLVELGQPFPLVFAC